MFSTVSIIKLLVQQLSLITKNNPYDTYKLLIDIIIINLRIINIRINE